MAVSGGAVSLLALCLAGGRGSALFRGTEMAVQEPLGLSEFPGAEVSGRAVHRAGEAFFPSESAAEGAGRAGRFCRHGERLCGIAPDRYGERGGPGLCRMPESQPGRIGDRPGAGGAAVSVRAPAARPGIEKCAAGELSRRAGNGGLGGTGRPGQGGGGECPRRRLPVPVQPGWQAVHAGRGHIQGTAGTVGGRQVRFLVQPVRSEE